MSVTLPGGTTRDDALAAYHGLVAELREVEHWRRLVAARLDLAVAAVTDIDELTTHPVDGACVPPAHLRDLLGIPEGSLAAVEASALPRLRAALDGLDAYAAALRPGVTAAARAAGVPPARMAVVSGRTRTAPSGTTTSRAAATPAPAQTQDRPGAAPSGRRRARLVPVPRPAAD